MATNHDTQYERDCELAERERLDLISFLNTTKFNSPRELMRRILDERIPIIKAVQT